MSSSLKNCRLCPRHCGVDRTHAGRGVCGADAHMKVARAALHMWEEPPLSGESGSGTVFFSHCPLGCIYCQNYEISGRGNACGREALPDEVAQMCLDLEEQGALNINMVTATHYAPLVREAVCIAHKRGMKLPIVWNTSGYETVEAIRDNADCVDVYLTDFKYASSGLASDMSSVPDYPEVALAALHEMVRQVGEPVFDDYHGQRRMCKGVIVRHMILPGHLDDSMQVVKLLHEHFGDKILLSLMNQYTPVLSTRMHQHDGEAAAVLKHHPELADSVSHDEYERLLDYVDALGIEDYFWQEGGAAVESFIPNWDDVEEELR